MHNRLTLLLAPSSQSQRVKTLMGQPLQGQIASLGGSWKAVHTRVEMWTDIFNTSLSLFQAVMPEKSFLCQSTRVQQLKLLMIIDRLLFSLIIMKCFKSTLMDRGRRNSTQMWIQTCIKEKAVCCWETKHLYLSAFYGPLLIQDNWTSVNKLLLELPPSLCNWLLKFLTQHPYTARINGFSSTTIIHSFQGCILISTVYTLLTYASPKTSKLSGCDDRGWHNGVDEYPALLRWRRWRTWCSDAGITTSALMWAKQSRWLWALGWEIMLYFLSTLEKV